VNDCGHRCCRIAGNAYHSHVEPPTTCPRCAALVPPEEADVAGLAHLVADVVANVAPQIPGLPGGPTLAELVGEHALAVFRSALAEPTLQVMPRAERRTVLAGRVALVLAFPGEISF
jgi:hypothetical protein